MSLKTMSTVSTSFQFAGEKVSLNLVEFIRRENIEISDDQVRAIQRLIKSSVEQAFSLTCESIEKSLEE
tara:strand:- start:58 stop:264 length:207 start_codon:yes stop_codon:yes gene_type:complete